jgi:hypothetical protein
MFSIRLGRPDGLVQKESSGRARVDDERAIVDLQVTLGDEIVSDDRDLTFLVAHPESDGASDSANSA